MVNEPPPEPQPVMIDLDLPVGSIRIWTYGHVPNPWRPERLHRDFLCFFCGEHTTRSGITVLDGQTEDGRDRCYPGCDLCLPVFFAGGVTTLFVGVPSGARGC